MPAWPPIVRSLLPWPGQCRTIAAAQAGRLVASGCWPSYSSDQLCQTAENEALFNVLSFRTFVQATIIAH